MMGPECIIYTTNHAFDRTDIPMCEQKFSDEKPVIIGNDVWIGGRVIILPGVHIGNGVTFLPIITLPCIFALMPTPERSPISVVDVIIAPFSIFTSLPTYFKNLLALYALSFLEILPPFE